MLVSLYLHSYTKQTALVPISGTTEVASVRLVLKLLVTFWWELNSCLNVFLDFSFNVDKFGNPASQTGGYYNLGCQKGALK